MTQNSPELTHHLVLKLEQLFEKTGVEFPDLVTALKIEAEKVGQLKKIKDGDPWAGEDPLSTEEALVRLSGSEQHVVLASVKAIEFACTIEIQPNGIWERNYSEDTSQSMRQEVDKMFKDWMQANNLKRVNHCMYTQDDEMLTPDALGTRFADPTQGFARYVANHSAGQYQLNLTLRQLDAPAPAESSHPSTN